MTYEEAIKHIKRHIYHQKIDGDEQMYTNAALNLAIKACEKQIPKKPIIWENRHCFSPTPNDDWGYECPCCGNDDIDYPQHHCECGQALDWSIEEEEEIKEVTIDDVFDIH